MGDNEQLQLYSKPFFVIPPSLRKEVLMQKQNILDEITNAISKPWNIKGNLICVDTTMSEDEVGKLMALDFPFTTSYGTLLPNIKRIKKHYKPKFTL